MTHSLSSEVCASVPSRAPELGGPSGPADPLRAALLESRQRWRDLASLAADLVFETDEWGRFSFVAPDAVLGWSAAALIGQAGETLLTQEHDTAGFDPFRPTTATRHRRAWLRHADGSTVCFDFATMPLLDGAGQIVGARGAAQDVTAQEGAHLALTGKLRRGEVLDHILWRMRQEVLAPRMMQAALHAVRNAAGAAGVVIVDTLADLEQPGILHQTDPIASPVMDVAARLLDEGCADTTLAESPEGQPVLLCPIQTRFGEQVALVMWREAGGRAWDADDRMLASSATGIVRVVLEHESIQREMARQARTDPLTGLLNRRAFLEETARRIERLDREGLPGTLIFVDLDRFKELNDRRGHDVGDDALCIIASLLRGTFRPADLVARLGGDEFAVWLDGADELAAAERAETLRCDGPQTLAHLTEGTEIAVTMSIGIASRWPGRFEEIDDLMQRADQVMYDVKRSGRGQWRVSQPVTG